VALDSGGSGGGSSDPAQSDGGASDSDPEQDRDPPEDPNTGGNTGGIDAGQTTEPEPSNPEPDSSEPDTQPEDPAGPGPDAGNGGGGGRDDGGGRDNRSDDTQPRDPSGAGPTAGNSGTGGGSREGGPTDRPDDRRDDTEPSPSGEGDLGPGAQRPPDSNTGSAPRDDRADRESRRADVSRERSVQDEDLNRREEAALDQYLQENPSYNQSDIADVETTEGGEFSIEFTSSGQREYVDQNLQGTEQMGSAPEGAEQLMSRSGEDATVVYDQGAEVGDGPIAEQAADVEQEVLEDNPSLDANDVRVNVSATGEFSVELTEEGRNEVREAANDPNRANQSVSLGTTGTGTTGTQQSRNRAEQRASEGASFGTTGMGTSGTEQSRERAQTQRAGESVSLGTTGFGTTNDVSQPALQEVDDTSAGGADAQAQNADQTGEREEQFGDIDWSLGFGGPEDEVEQFVDEGIGDEGSEWVGETISNPLRDVADAAGESKLLASGPSAVPTGVAGPLLGQDRDTADTAETYLDVTANAAEDLPQAPGAALELVETNKYVYGPALGGDVSESGSRASEVAVVGGMIAMNEGERAVKNPNRAVAEASLGVLSGRAGLAARRAATGANAIDSGAALGGARSRISRQRRTYPTGRRRSSPMTGRSST